MHGKAEGQCDQILRNFATLAKFYANLWQLFLGSFRIWKLFETFQRENCISTNVPCSNGQILIIWSHCWGPTGCLLPSLEPQWPLPRRSLVEWDEPLDRPNGQTRVECGFVWAAAIFEVFNNHNNLLLGWYYCSSPYTKELHGFTYWDRSPRKKTFCQNAFKDFGKKNHQFLLWIQKRFFDFQIVRYFSARNAEIKFTDFTIKVFSSLR